MIEFTDFSFYNKTWFRILRVSELSHYCSQNLYLTINILKTSRGYLN